MVLSFLPFSDAAVAVGISSVFLTGPIAEKQTKPRVCGSVLSVFSLGLAVEGGIRGMERGTLSEERNPDGSERIAAVEMVRLAFPRRVFTLSQTEYVIDRVKWLYDHRHLIGGLRFVHEPKSLRFFTGRLEPIGDWPERLVEAYKADFED